MAAVVIVGGSALALRKHPVPSGLVTVSVFDDGSPLPDRAVVFQDASGEVTASLKSGPDGKVASMLAAGGMITVAYGTSVRQLVTIVGVAPGDTIEIGEHDNDEEGAGDTAALARVTLPGSLDGGARYSVDLGVGAIEPRQGVARLPVLRRFVGADGGFSVLGLAYRADGRPAAFSFLETSLATPDAGDVAVTLPAWRTDFQGIDLALGRLEGDLHVTTGELTTIAKEQQFSRASARVDPSGEGMTKVHFDVPGPLATTMSYRLELGYGASNDRAVLVRRLAAFPDVVGVDLGTMLLPRVSAAHTEPTSEPARPRLGWTATGGSNDADALVVQLAWPRTKEHVWTILAPPSSRAGLRVPALPEALRAWRPDGQPVQLSVALVDSTEISGYADARQHGVHRFSELPDRESAMRISRTGEIDF